MTERPVDGAAAWRLLDPVVAARAADARLQIHHAAQLATAIGISYLPRQADDSHTNLEWLAGHDALAARAVPGRVPLRIAVRPHPFALLALVDGAPIASFVLDGQTVAGAERWVRSQLTGHGIDPAAYTLSRHYTIPAHPVDKGAAFAPDVRTFDEISHWFGNAARVLEAFAMRTPGTSEVRCWPHHFDIGALVALRSGSSIGLGMEPGDASYDEPYWYVNPYPAPADTGSLPALAGNGEWHQEGWLGAVLAASRLSGAVAEQREQVTEFIDSAVAACARLRQGPAGR